MEKPKDNEAYNIALNTALQCSVKPFNAKKEEKKLNLKYTIK